MKKLPYVEPVSFVDHRGEPVIVDGKQLVLTDLEFFLDRTVEPGICGDRKGYSQIQFTESLQLAIKSQAETAKTEGWNLEDAHYEALKNHLAKADLIQAMLHNIKPFIERFFV